MKEVKKCAPQGDALMFRVDALPANAQPVKAENGLLLVTHSETGHHHAVDARPGLELFQHPTNPLVGWLRITQAAEVQQWQYNTRQIKAGMEARQVELAEAIDALLNKDEELSEEDEVRYRALTDEHLACWEDVQETHTGRFADVVHHRPWDTHETLRLLYSEVPSGETIFEIHRQREHSPEGWRRVAD